MAKTYKTEGTSVIEKMLQKTERPKEMKVAVVESVITNDIENNVLDNEEYNAKSNMLHDILNNKIEKETPGSNVTFYLSAEVCHALTAVAKKNKVSKSKLVDTILKEVLFES